MDKLLELEKKAAEHTEDMQEALTKMENSKNDAEAFKSAKNLFSNIKAMLEITNDSIALEKEAVANEKKAQALVADAFAKPKAGLTAEESAKRAVKVESMVMLASITGRDFGVPNDYREEVDAFKNTMSTTSGPDGGFTIPKYWSDVIEKVMKKYGGILPLCSRISTPDGNPIIFPIVDNTALSPVKGVEGVKATGNNAKIVFSNAEFTVHRIDSDAIPVTDELLVNSILNIRTLILDSIGESFGRKLSQLLLTGTGNGEMKGLIPLLGNERQITSNVSGKVTYDDFVDMIHKVEPAYRDGAVFVISDGLEKEMKKWKDTAGNVLWVGSTREGEPSTIAGRPYIVDYNLADVAGNALVAIFGTFKDFYVREVPRLGTIRADSSGKNAQEFVTLFFGCQTWGCLVKNAAKFVVLKVKA